MAYNYVKFERGSKRAFQRLIDKNPNTLYFITDEDNKIYMYLGDKLITGGGNVSIDNSSIDSLADVVLTEVGQNQILIFDEEANAWKNVDLATALSAMVMVGASSENDGASGIVPKPLKADKDKFLKGDGSWSKISVTDLSEYVEGARLIKDKEIEKLEKLVIDENGNTVISGTVSAENVIGLNDLIEEKTQEIIGSLKNKVDNLDEILNGIEEDQDNGVEGKEGLIAQFADLQTQVGDLNSLVDYRDEEDKEQETQITIVNAINEIYERLTWEDLEEE